MQSPTYYEGLNKECDYYNFIDNQDKQDKTDYPVYRVTQMQGTIFKSFGKSDIKVNRSDAKWYKSFGIF